MAIASLVSRITGFLRSVAIAAAVGAGIYSVGDAYGLANTLPNMVYELLLGGVLTSVLIPVLVKAQQDDQDRGVAYTQRLLSIATAGLAGATLLAVLAAPWLIGIFGGPPQYRSVAALWATLLLPEIFFYGLGRDDRGDPELPARLRLAGLGAGDEQPDHHRRGAAVPAGARVRRT